MVSAELLPSCGHSFCASCIRQLPGVCPLCRVPFEPGSSVPNWSLRQLEQPALASTQSISPLPAVPSGKAPPPPPPQANAPATAPPPPPPPPPLPSTMLDTELQLPGGAFDAAQAGHMHGALDTCRKLVNEASLQALIKNFRKHHCESFTSSTDENKLEHTALHEQFIELVDSELTRALNEQLGPDFAMAEFLTALPGFLASAAGRMVDDKRPNEVEDEYDRPATLEETMHVLQRLTSFEAFKADMLAARRSKLAEAKAVEEGMALYFKVMQPRKR